MSLVMVHFLTLRPSREDFVFEMAWNPEVLLSIECDKQEVVAHHADVKQLVEVAV